MIRIRKLPIPTPTDDGYMMGMVDLKASREGGHLAWQACVIEEWEQSKGGWVAVPIVTEGTP